MKHKNAVGSREIKTRRLQLRQLFLGKRPGNLFRQLYLLNNIFGEHKLFQQDYLLEAKFRGAVCVAYVIETVGEQVQNQAGVEKMRENRIMRLWIEQPFIRGLGAYPVGV